MRAVLRQRNRAVQTRIVRVANGRDCREPVKRAANNVPWLTVESPSHVSVYQLLRAHHVVFEREGLRALEEALSS